MHDVDARGEVTDTRGSDGTFKGVRGLSALLARSDDVRECSARTWKTWATGTGAAGLACALRNDSPSGALTSVRDALASSGWFRVRRDGPEEQDAPAAVPGEPEPLPDAPTSPPPTTGELQVVVSENARLPTGACWDVVVTNGTAEERTWSVARTVPVVMTSVWNAQASGDRGEVLFSGVSWNATLAPGAAASSGFCEEL